MPQNENPKQPLSKKDLIDVLASGATLLTFLFFPTGLQIGSAPATQPTPTIQPAPIINIYQQPGSNSTIKFEQFQNKVKQLNESEDDETLSKAREAISELRKIISEKKSDLEHGKVQLISQGGTLKLSAEQLQAKAELENNIVRLQEEIAKLNRIQQRIEASQEAINLLNPETEQKLLFAWAKEAGDTVLNAQPELTNSWKAAEVNRNTRQFYFDIKHLLSLIHTCLLTCRPNILDRSLTEDSPKAPLPVRAYVSAFELIRDQKVPNAISGAAATELTAYLNYLIDKLPSAINYITT
jgi:Phycobilisome protein